MPIAESQRQQPQYSIVVPVFESDRSVVELVERLSATFENIICASYEVILVDDGSRSAATWSTLESLVDQYPEVRAVRLMRNYGKPSAVLCGLERVRGRWVITLDDDLQQRPEDIPALIAYQDHDVVVANFEERQHDPVTVFTSWVKSKFDRIILGLPCKMSPMKLFKVEVARGMVKVQTARPFIPALMAYVTNDFVAVTVAHERSRHGRSRYNLLRRFRQFSNLLIGNSSLLLRSVGAFGGAVALAGFIYAAYLVFRKLIGASIEPGWTSLVVINLIFGGLILLSLGIVGEYLLRILEGSSQKPPFIIRETVGDSNDGQSEI